MIIWVYGSSSGSPGLFYTSVGVGWVGVVLLWIIKRERVGLRGGLRVMAARGVLNLGYNRGIGSRYLGHIAGASEVALVWTQIHVSGPFAGISPWIITNARRIWHPPTSVYRDCHPNRRKPWMCRTLHGRDWTGWTFSIRNLSSRLICNGTIPTIWQKRYVCCEVYIKKRIKQLYLGRPNGSKSLSNNWRFLMSWRWINKKFASIHERERGPSACGSSFPQPLLSFVLVTWGNGEDPIPEYTWTKYSSVYSISPARITRGRSACRSRLETQQRCEVGTSTSGADSLWDNTQNSIMSWWYLPKRNRMIQMHRDCYELRMRSRKFWCNPIWSI